MPHPHPFTKIADELIADLRGIPREDTTRTIRATQPISAVVEQLVRKYEIGVSSPAQALRDHWVEIVGPANAAYSNPARIERNQVMVVTSHAIVRNELFLQRAEIVSRIRGIPGCESVKSIHLQ